MTWLLRLLGWRCSHSELYRERRPLHDVAVMHWVCSECGYASPAVHRSPAEHRQAVQAGTGRSVLISKPEPAGGAVLQMRQKGRTR